MKTDEHNERHSVYISPRLPEESGSQEHLERDKDDTDHHIENQIK